MPSPSGTIATLRPDLGGSFEEFDLEMQRRGYVANRVLPVFESQVQSGTFGIIPLEQLLQTNDTKRAPGGGYNRGNWTFDDVTFACKEFGWEEPIDDREAKMYANYFDAEVVSTRRAYEFVLGAAERRVAALMFNATTFSGKVTSAGAGLEWSDHTNSLPIDNVETAVLAVFARTGMWPNAMVINRKVFRNLRQCAQIIDRIVASGAGSPAKASDVTADMLARVFDLQEIIVAGTSKNTATEGQTASLAQNWSDEYAMVFCKAQTNDIREACLGRTFHWAADGSEVGGTVETYRDETKRSDISRVRHDVDEKLIYIDCAQLIDNVTE